MIRLKKIKYYKVFLALASTLGLIIVFYGIFIFNIAFKHNVKLLNTSEYFLKIPTNSTFKNLIEIIENEDVLINTNSFIKLAKKKKIS